MSITFDDIYSLKISENFGLDGDYDTTEVVDDVLSQLHKIDPKVHTSWGCSKFIIFLNDDEVIKIPFKGTYCYDWDLDDGTVKFIPFMTEDYCDIEAYLYDMAVEYGVEKFFAKTEYAGSINDTTLVYKSERVIPYEYGDFEKASADSYQKIKEKNSEGIYYPIATDWVAKAFDYYTEDEIENLFKFIDEFDIRDLHTANIGFRKDGSPVILDYSSFYEEGEI